MTKFIDLNTMVGESLEIMGTDNQTYRIPGDIPTGFYFKFLNYHQELNKLKNEEERIKFMKQICIDILNLDLNKNVDMEYFNKYFDNMVIMMALVDILTEHFKKILSDPNSNGPKSIATEAN